MIVREVIDKWPPVRDPATMTRNLRSPRTGATAAERAYAGTRYQGERRRGGFMPAAAWFLLGIVTALLLAACTRAPAGCPNDVPAEPVERMT